MWRTVENLPIEFPLPHDASCLMEVSGEKFTLLHQPSYQGYYEERAAVKFFRLNDSASAVEFYMPFQFRLQNYYGGYDQTIEDFIASESMTLNVLGQRDWDGAFWSSGNIPTETYDPVTSREGRDVKLLLEEELERYGGNNLWLQVTDWELGGSLYPIEAEALWVRYKTASGEFEAKVPQYDVLQIPDSSHQRVSDAASESGVEISYALYGRSGMPELITEDLNRKLSPYSYYNHQDGQRLRIAEGNGVSLVYVGNDEDNNYYDPNQQNALYQTENAEQWREITPDGQLTIEELVFSNGMFAAVGSYSVAFDEPIRKLASSATHFACLSDSGFQVSEFFVEGAPDFTEIPRNTFSLPNDRITLVANATGTGSISYQWYRGESGDESQPIVGADESTFTTEPLLETSQFWVRASNSISEDRSPTITLTMQTQPEIFAIIYTNRKGYFRFTFIQSLVSVLLIMDSESQQIHRAEDMAKLCRALELSRAVALVGPRQCGKTTLARQLVEISSPNYFDLEDEADLARLENASFALGSLTGLVVIDEVQRRPDLFPTLRVLIDRPDNAAQFLILGSASPDLLRQSSETLAGRIATIELSGFSLAEVGEGAMRSLWLRGGFPRSFLASSEEGSFFWRKNFSRDFLERDLRLLGLEIAPVAIGRLWKMLGHYHGQNLNNAELGRSLGMTAPTVRRYVDVLNGAFMIRQLQPWFENIKKRQVKSPKIYFRDSGILHYQLGVEDEAALLGHPKLGTSWEGFVLEQAIRFFKPEDQYFWSTQSDAELDLLMFIKGKRIGLECKFTDAPKVTASMRSAIKLLKLEHLYVAYTGTKRYMLDEKIEVLPVTAFAKSPI